MSSIHIPQTTRSILHCCYGLKSLNPLYSNNASYIGYTVNPRRRIRQHNGEISMGARKTKTKRPWEMQYCLFGFPTRIDGLQFEWQWQHVKKALNIGKTIMSWEMEGIEAIKRDYGIDHTSPHGNIYYIVRQQNEKIKRGLRVVKRGVEGLALVLALLIMTQQWSILSLNLCCLNRDALELILKSVLLVHYAKTALICPIQHYEPTDQYKLEHQLTQPALHEQEMNDNGHENLDVDQNLSERDETHKKCHISKKKAKKSRKLPKPIPLSQIPLPTRMIQNNHKNLILTQIAPSKRNYVEYIIPILEYLDQNENSINPITGTNWVEFGVIDHFPQFMKVYVGDLINLPCYSANDRKMYQKGRLVDHDDNLDNMGDDDESENDSDTNYEEDSNDEMNEPTLKQRVPKNNLNNSDCQQSVHDNTLKNINHNSNIYPFDHDDSDGLFSDETITTAARSYSNYDNHTWNEYADEPIGYYDSQYYFEDEYLSDENKYGFPYRDDNWKYMNQEHLEKEECLHQTVNANDPALQDSNVYNDIDYICYNDFREDCLISDTCERNNSKLQHFTQIYHFGVNSNENQSSSPTPIIQSRCASPIKYSIKATTPKSLLTPLNSPKITSQSSRYQISPIIPVITPKKQNTLTSLDLIVFNRYKFSLQQQINKTPPSTPLGGNWESFQEDSHENYDAKENHQNKFNNNNNIVDCSDHSSSSSENSPTLSSSYKSNQLQLGQKCENKTITHFRSPNRDPTQSVSLIKTLKNRKRKFLHHQLVHESTNTNNINNPSSNDNSTTTKPLNLLLSSSSDLDIFPLKHDEMASAEQTPTKPLKKRKSNDWIDCDFHDDKDFLLLDDDNGTQYNDNYQIYKQNNVNIAMGHNDDNTKKSNSTLNSPQKTPYTNELTNLLASTIEPSIIFNPQIPLPSQSRPNIHENVTFLDDTQSDEDEYSQLDFPQQSLINSKLSAISFTSSQLSLKMPALKSKLHSAHFKVSVAQFPPLSAKTREILLSKCVQPTSEKIVNVIGKKEAKNLFSDQPNVVNNFNQYKSQDDTSDSDIEVISSPYKGKQRQSKKR